MEGKEKFIQIIESLTALIEHNPEETIKTALLDSIKAKTKVLKDSEVISIRNNLQFPKWVKEFIKGEKNEELIEKKY